MAAFRGRLFLRIPSAKAVRSQRLWHGYQFSVEMGSDLAYSFLPAKIGLVHLTAAQPRGY